ncbi:2-desacetyl-2-hydroxyethyl bacteriochlorophyllide A dehydrogenase [Sinosporangium album]|uniref:2-desacetyl-2-hydroxyethyl bacteriochlorophyllide A dehydrogenase n=1 Tax=Sinosporangium album TaxID=504805 RepID=A0A1G8A6G8_9ACTN|nr:alcohol dehydrogenase catalytic domain-containing protein [Sinosporangium album]SDH16544.1 2-desacetyl-2-hydroxyethyl bacteriochlorophyllide A dehydrogenase [Sinosporangium album]
MRGVVYRAPGRIEVTELPMPAVKGPRDAVVRVTRSAICGTDLHPYRGEIPGFEAGTVLGHEFAGVVHEAGPEVPFAVGQRVFASDVIACGRCGYCARGHHYQCAHVGLFGYASVVGEPVAGGQAEYVRVPYADLVLAATPDGVTDEQAVFVGDVLSTAYCAVRDSGATPGATVAVVGGGPVGLLCALCARLAGAAVIVAADPDPARRETLEAFGVRASDPAELSRTLRELTAGRGADAVIEAVGSDTALRYALETAAPRATVAVVGAHHAEAMPFPSGLAFARELIVRFTVGDPIAVRANVLELIRAGRIDPSAVVSHRLPLEDAARAYRLSDRRQAFKTVLNVDQEGDGS